MLAAVKQSRQVSLDFAVFLRNVSPFQGFLAKHSMLRISPLKSFGAFTSKCCRKVEEIYEMISPHDHILHRPDMYIGSVANVDQQAWVYDDKAKSMKHQDISYSAGLYKIVDEILVNAADNHAEEPGKCKNISVEVGKDGSICIRNDGSGIPVVRHKVSDLWLPVMLFGHLLTSSNYRKTRTHLTGGRFGYGAKLTNILSKEFMVETCDEKSGLTCQVKWHNNMRTMDEPQIRKNEPHTPGYTKIAFTPDYQFFGMESLTPDMYKVLKRRLYDFTGLAPGLELHWNGEKLLTKNFTEYAILYPGDASSVHAQSASCEIILRVSTDGFQQVSFVNSVHTNDGGTHVEYVMDIICEYILDIVQRSFPFLHISPDFIRSNIFLFLNLRIQEPEFDSQNKSALQSPISSVTDLPDLQELARQFVVRTRIVQIISGQLGKVRDSAACDNLPNLLAEKLVDAEKADSDEKERCTLIIVEGDSAMSVALTGLSIIGQAYYGIFPLKGKIRNATQIDQGDEYTNSVVRDLLRCLTSVDEKGRAHGLRYGKVLLMTDQDNDGVHIKALLCNLFLKFLPRLMTENRICHFVTPLIKLTAAGKSHEFYSVEEFDKQKAKYAKVSGRHHIKYYKGLGSHNQDEVKRYFSKFDSHVRSFNYDEARDRIYFRQAFDLDRSDDRKKWILGYTARQASGETGDSLEPNAPLTFQKFFETDYLKAAVELFHRTMPHYIDGLNPIKRKIIHCVLRGKSESKKVVQLAGYVSHHSAYHHGEANISKCVVQLAQNFVGSNNLPLIRGEGNFGTRAEGGDDHAKDRYIFARGGRVLNYIFRPEDDAHLSYKECEGIVAEPEYYCPIIPVHFVNGCDSIAYGWRSHFPKQAPIDLIRALRRILENVDTVKYRLNPSFVGYRGSVAVGGNDVSYRTYGKFSRVGSNGIHITELPIGTWTTPYTQILEQLRENKIVFTYLEYHRGGNVDIHVYFYEQLLDIMEKAGYMHVLPKLLGLVGRKRNALPVCSSHETNVREFASLDDAMQAYIKARLDIYKLRSASVLQELKKKKATLEAHIAFLDLLESKKITFTNSTLQITELLKENGVEEKYIQALMKMDISSLGNGASKRTDLAAVDRRIAAHKRKTPTQLWLDDLAELEAQISGVPLAAPRVMQKKSAPKVTSQGLMNLKVAIQSIGVNESSLRDSLGDTGYVGTESVVECE
ncbi:DNA topoisomerase II [Perkinsela sp. CCAP 1560/4]|nr:DNA topoisomerase II [Perkinsela sp. CCAP 1560/4]|eukprot:KNH09266.1 DNA topoisomerase II [Perkinsela sp. CCAP 1560/4]